MTVYHDLFSSWADVQSQFEMSEREPDEVLVAVYSYEDYSGSAWVVYRNGSKFYEASGSHCSCYGIEGQWAPEGYDNAALMLAALNRRNYFGAGDQFSDDVKKRLAAEAAQ